MHCVGLTFFTKQKYNNLIINEEHVYEPIESFVHSLRVCMDESCVCVLILCVFIQISCMPSTESEIESKISFQ